MAAWHIHHNSSMVLCYHLHMTQHPTPIKFSQLDYRTDLDDRVVCNGCPHASVEDAQEFVAYDKAMAHIETGKPLGFDGDKIERRGNWMVISWQQVVCMIGKDCIPPVPVMPAGMLHRCRFIKPPHYQDLNQQAAMPVEAHTAPATGQTKEWWE